MNWIKTKEEARQYAISFEHWMSEHQVSYGEICIFHKKLTELAEKFDLVEEFEENGII